MMPGTPLLTRVLPYCPPYDWETVLAFFRAHQIPFLEAADESGYERVLRLRKGLGWFRVEHHPREHALVLSVHHGTEEDLKEILTPVRKMFDVDADPAVLLRVMKKDRFLAGFWERHAGLRLARFWSAEEAMFATVLGQLVSVKFGRVLIRELMQAAGAAAQHPKSLEPVFLFPSAEQIMQADLSSVRTSEARRHTIRSLAEALDKGVFALPASDAGTALRKALRGIPGIGAWTTEYVAMRGFHDDDAFPATDYALKQEVKLHEELSVEFVRPWRGYAAVALWKSFAEAKQIAATNRRRAGPG